VNIFASNFCSFAPLPLCLLFHVVFTWRTPKWRKLKLEERFCNWTKVDFCIKVAVGCDICVTSKTSDFLWFLVHEILRKFNSKRLCPLHLYTVAALHWKVQKVIFEQCYVLPNVHCRLLLNKMDYNCHNAAVREVTSYRKCSKWPPSARTQNTESVTPLFDRLTHDAPLEFSPCLNQPLPQLDHNPHSGVHAHVWCPRCDNP